MKTNPFAKPMRQAKLIKSRKNKSRAVRKWCALMREALEE